MDNCPRCRDESLRILNDGNFVLCKNRDCLWWMPIEAFIELIEVLE